jgi:hydrogenase/urease accessory protein HupE
MIKKISAFLILFLASAFSLAHEPFEITATARIFPNQISINLLITDTTAAKLCLPDTVSKLHDSELEQFYVEIEQCVATMLALKMGETLLTPARLEIKLTEEKDLDATIYYPPAQASELLIEATYLTRLDENYGSTITATNQHEFLAQKFLQGENRTLLLKLGNNQDVSPQRESFGSFVLLGIEHIVLGFDHLLFLAGLLVLGRQWKYLIAVITAFTIAHSITLVLSALGLIYLQGSLVEACIAASIVYVAIENLWLIYKNQQPKWRWLLAFLFGLLHGFGFAGALRETGIISGENLLIPLVGFNIGVELGQLAITALLLPPFLVILKNQLMRRWLPSSISCVVGIFGLYWLVDRVSL